MGEKRLCAIKFPPACSRRYNDYPIALPEKELLRFLTDEGFRVRSVRHREVVSTVAKYKYVHCSGNATSRREHLHKDVIGATSESTELSYFKRRSSS